MADINNTICCWEVSKTQVRHMFVRQAIPMVWTYGENNVFNKAAGDYQTSLNSLASVLETTLGYGPQGHATQQNAASAPAPTRRL